MRVPCISFLLLSGVAFMACKQPIAYPEGTYGADLEFLQEHKHTIVLKTDGDKCQVALVPDYQGRVMTSTGNGMDGRSFGWINTDHIASGMLSAGAPGESRHGCKGSHKPALRAVRRTGNPGDPG